MGGLVLWPNVSIRGSEVYTSVYAGSQAIHNALGEGKEPFLEAAQGNT